MKTVNLMAALLWSATVVTAKECVFNESDIQIEYAHPDYDDGIRFIMHIASGTVYN